MGGEGDRPESSGMKFELFNGQCRFEGLLGEEINCLRNIYFTSDITLCKRRDLNKLGIANRQD